ncbi:protein ROH1A [Magnolia sinica]|uniref:protein ROH1A n=1 Tax=Magnolia sinica TaxID=86752 RepID=UPI00265AC501|nr:protein ROH1A [Magnolia sinica]
MPATDYQGTSVPLAFFGRSILSIRRNQVVSMEGNHEQELEDFELFQKHVADRLADLASSDSKDDREDGLLSLPWLRKLLDFFLSCEEEFKAMLILGRNPTHISRPPLDRLITELLDRAVKALDVCNAITDGIDSIHHWRKQAEIAVSALEQRPLGEGQFRRAKRALTALVASMTIDDKDGQNRAAERTWSFGRKGNGSATAIKEHGNRHVRSFSWSVSRTWSASKQMQAMANNLAAPRGAELNGLALPIYTMGTILLFVMWALVAAIPCQDRSGLNMHFPLPPRQLAWAGPLISLQERIAEEWRKKEKKGSVGLMEELHELERCANGLMELTDTTQFPVEADQMDQIRTQAGDLAQACRTMEEELIPFRRQVREVFHRIVNSRTEVLDCLNQATRLPTTVL